MASSKNEPSADPVGDLATLISKGKVDKDMLQLFAEKGLLDIPDKDGRTPLMIACLKGLEDTVKFLLANGANPNSKCLKKGNTPMHYACIVHNVDELRGECALSGIYYSPAQLITPKIAIIKLLLGSGALVIEDNLYGWSPPCEAALYLMKDIVDFFLAMDDTNIPLEEKVKVLEILGVSQATLDPGSRCRGKFSSFSRALSFQQRANLPKRQSGTSELLSCFSKMSLHECNTEEEIESIKESNIAIMAHAFLVGEKLFPKDLIQKYLYPSLARRGCSLMWGSKMLEGFQVLSCAIGFEHQGKLKFGTVLSNLAHQSGIYASVFDKLGEPNHQCLQYVSDLLCEYESVLNHVPIDSLSDHSDILMESFGEILFSETFYCSTVDILQSKLQAIEKLVRIIRGRIRKENPDKYHALSSVTWKIMERLGGTFDFYMSNETLEHVHSRSLLRIKFVICKILPLESATYQDRDLGYTLLHLLADCVYGPAHLEHLKDLALLFVRHGCPIDGLSLNGDTARDILELMYDSEIDPQFRTLFSPTTTVLTLEEVATRKILQNNIGYRGKIPTRLCEMLEGGLKNSDLEQAND